MPQKQYNPDKSYVGMARCFFCQKEDKILLDRTLRDSLPRDCGVIDLDPCTECAGYMKQGILLISVRVGEMEAVAKDQESYKESYDRASTYERKRLRPFIPNPYRTGGWCVVKEDAVKRFVQPSETLTEILRCRWSFVDDQTWEKLGLPRGDYPEKKGGDK